MQKIGSAVLEALRAAKCKGNLVKLTGQLGRPLYVATNKVLEALGGKWNRKLGGHVFPGDAAATLAVALGEGTYHDKKKEDAFFETPPELAQELMELADIKPGMRVLEPSAGKGALVRLAAAAGASVDAIELNPDFASTLGVGGAHGVLIGDFLTLLIPADTFDRVVMNPPFSAGHKQVDILHVEKALSLLKPGGILVAIMSPSWKTREDKQSRHFRKLWDAQGVMFKDNPDGAFKASGTDVRTVTVVMRKPV